MPHTITASKVATALGRTYSDDLSTQADMAIPHSPSVAAAKVGELTTRTDNDTGVLTMVTGHGIITSDKVDVYWTGGSRYNMTATVAGDAVTVDGGTGDNLPALNTDVTAMVRHSEDAMFDGDNVVAIMFTAPTQSDVNISFCEVAGTPDFTMRIAAGESYIWLSTDGTTNPLAGLNAIVAIESSHGYSTSALTLNGIVLYN